MENREKKSNLLKPALCTLVVGLFITAGIVSAQTVFLSNQIETTMNIDGYPLILEQAYPYSDPVWKTDPITINSVVKGQPYSIGAQITNSNPGEVTDANLVFRVTSTDGFDVSSPTEDFTLLQFTIGGSTTVFTTYAPVDIQPSYIEWYVPILIIPTGTYTGVLDVTFSGSATGSYILNAQIIQVTQ
jgi:hypothetical protein